MKYFVCQQAMNMYEQAAVGIIRKLF